VTRDAATLLVLTLVGAVWLVVHCALVFRTLRATQLSLPVRALSLLPLATPVIGWRAGAYVQCVLWAVFAVAYGVLLRLS
jgi:hypothetical protein